MMSIATDTINSLRGSGAVELNTGITLTTGDANNQTISGINLRCG